MQFLYLFLMLLLTKDRSFAEFLLILVTFYLLWQEDAMRDQIKILRERVTELEKKNRN